jgi:hypothetical protein
MTPDNLTTLRPYVRHEMTMRELRQLKRRTDIQEAMLVAIIAVQLINLVIALR